jgi:predicted nuclease with TOPRIM domain
METLSNRFELEESRSGDPRQQLKTLDAEVARLESLLGELKRKRVSLKEQINHLVAPKYTSPSTRDIFPDISRIYYA